MYAVYVYCLFKGRHWGRMGYVVEIALPLWSWGGGPGFEVINDATKWAPVTRSCGHSWWGLVSESGALVVQFVVSETLKRSFKKKG